MKKFLVRSLLKMQLVLVFSSILFNVPGVNAANVFTECHIHPPGQLINEKKRQALIGPFANQSSCEQDNQMMFSGQGRCHCVVSFSSNKFKSRKALSPEEF